MAANLRRLALDHASLHISPPSDYFFPPNESVNLQTLDVYLCGPASTPFESGVFQINLRIPPNYPAEPPKATFRTRIFHPNVDPRSGDVCVDTLKRDWNPKLTLRDVLITIRCLLVYPNPTSSLNEEAGRLQLEDFDGFARHATLMTEVHASVPSELASSVTETRRRDSEQDEEPAAAKTAASKNDVPALSPVKQKLVGTEVKQATTPGRKVKRAASPTAVKKPIAVAANEGSDSEGSGKENAVTVLVESPTGVKRTREDSERVAHANHDAKENANGRKSPKLSEFPNSTLNIKKASRSTAGKPVKKLPSDKDRKVPKFAPLKRVGLKRF